VRKRNGSERPVGDFFLPCFLKEEDIFVEPAFLGIQILKNFEALRYDRLALKKEVGFHA